ncbi:MAG: GTPase HflX [Rubrobacteraceae bacterium]
MQYEKEVMEQSEERAILVAAGEDRQIEELSRLAWTLGVEVAGYMEQNRRDGKGYLGKGKRAELATLVTDKTAGIVITDDELSASQSRLLEKDAGAPIVDRTELIIRIFESHARDRASRLEVELADLEYRLPRIKGRNVSLSRLGGGVGTRGPGEQQLEYDRRVIRERIDIINRRLRQEKSARETQGARLKRGGPPMVSLVGYTNAGKTTILNALSGAGRSTRDRLFETLETTTRLVSGEESGSPDFALTDTVGFIRKLPTQLVHSFTSTLEAARDADILVLCADASSVSLEDEISTVRRTLSELSSPDTEKDGSSAQSTILCLNKTDLLSDIDREKVSNLYPDAVTISATEDVGDLLNAIHSEISSGRERMEILIPHSEYGLAGRLYGLAEIHASRHTPEGVLLDVSLPNTIAFKYSPFKVS